MIPCIHDPSVAMIREFLASLFLLSVNLSGCDQYCCEARSLTIPCMIVAKIRESILLPLSVHLSLWW